MEFTVEQIKEIVSEAMTAAHEAGMKYFNEKLNGQDQYSCGFAWVNIYKIKGNTKLGKAMKAAGLEKDYTGAYQIWVLANFHVRISMLRKKALGLRPMYSKSTASLLMLVADWIKL